MKVRQFFPAILFGIGVLFFASCDLGGDNPPITQNDYSKGVFVVNEGPFGGTGTITWYNPDNGEAVQDVFGIENGGTLGQFAISLAFHNGKGYICVTSVNLLVVVDQTTFRFLDTIGGLIQPRFFQAIDDDYAYVSQWGKDGIDGSVAKIDLKTNQIVKVIPTGKGPEKMFLKDANTLLVANSGGFDVDSTISVIDLVSETETSRTTVGGKAPCCFAKANFTGANPWVLCKGTFDAAMEPGFLDKFDPPGSGFTVPNNADDLCSSPAGNQLYYIGDGKVWAANQFAVSELFSQPAYGLACHPSNGNLYCADPKGFSAAGEVVIYNPGGVKVGSFATGIGPGEIIIVE